MNLFQNMVESNIFYSVKNIGIPFVLEGYIDSYTLYQKVIFVNHPYQNLCIGSMVNNLGNKSFLCYTMWRSFAVAPSSGTLGGS